MAEIKVKLIAEAQELLKSASDAARQVQRNTPVIKINADTSPFLAAVKRAVKEAQNLQPVIKVSGVGSGSPPQSGSPQSGSGQNGAGSSQADPNKALLNFLRSSQTSNAKNSQELKKSIDELARMVEKLAAKGGSGGGGGNGGGGGGQGGETNWLLRWLGMKSSGEDGQFQIKDILGGLTGGGGGNGLLSMLSAIPGLGMLTSILTGAGMMRLIAQQAQKEAQYNKQTRDSATDILGGAYDTFGSVRAFDPSRYGEEGYTAGAYAAMDTGLQYGYDINTTFASYGALLDKGGFTTTQDMQDDARKVLATSRATGVDTSVVATLAGTASKVGFQDNGDAGKIMGMLGRQIEVSGMRGREDEMVDVLQSILDELGAVNATVSEQAVGDKLNLMNLLTANNPNLNGDRAKSAIDSLEDYTSSNDMSVMRAAGFGTKFLGKEGFMTLRRMQEENPTAFAGLVIQGYKAHDMSKTDIAFALDQKGVGSTLMNDALLDAHFSGQLPAADMTDDQANRIGGADYVNAGTNQFRTTVGPYVGNEINESIQDFTNGATELYQYKSWYAANNAKDAQGKQSEGWWRNHLDQWSYDNSGYKYGLRDKSAQYDAMDAAKNSLQSGVAPTGSGQTYGYQGVNAGTGGNEFSAPPTGTSNASAPSAQAAFSGGGPMTGLGIPGAAPQDAGSYENIARSLKAHGLSAADIAYILNRAGVTNTDTGSADTYAQTYGMEPVAGDVGNNISYMWNRLTGKAESPLGPDGKRSAGTALAASLGLASPMFGIPLAAGTMAAMSGGVKGQPAPESAGYSAAAVTYPAMGMPVQRVQSLQENDMLHAQEPAPLLQTNADEDYIDALVRNTEELRKNTEALGGGGTVLSNDDRYVTGSQQQAALQVNAEQDPLSGNLSIQSPMMRSQQRIQAGENFWIGSNGQSFGGSFGNRSSVGYAGTGDAAGSASTTGTGDDAGSDDTTKTTGTGRFGNKKQDSESSSKSGATQTVSSGSGQGKSTITKPDGTVITEYPDGTRTVTHPDGTKTEEKINTKSNTLEMSGVIPAAVGNDYVPYDDYKASLHRGEMVLPKDEAALFRQGRLGSAVSSAGLFGAQGRIAETAGAEEEVRNYIPYDGYVMSLQRGDMVLTKLEADKVRNTDEAQPHATGNDYIPYDDYKASLHKGEMVLPKDEAALFRQGRYRRPAVQNLAEGKPYGEIPDAQEKKRDDLWSDLAAKRWSGEKRAAQSGRIGDAGASESAGAWMAAQIVNDIPAAGSLREYTNPPMWTTERQDDRPDVSSTNGHSMNGQSSGNLHSHFKPVSKQGQLASHILSEFSSHASSSRWISEWAAKAFRRSDDTLGTAFTDPYNQAQAGQDERHKASAAETADKARETAMRAYMDGFLAELPNREVSAAEYENDLSVRGHVARKTDRTANPLVRANIQQLNSALENSSLPDHKGPLDTLPAYGAAESSNVLGEQSEPETLVFTGGDININIRVTGQVEGMNPAMQKQMVDSIQAQIAGAGLRDMVSNGFTRRQNW